jgi:hypothetical protein
VWVSSGVTTSALDLKRVGSLLADRLDAIHSAPDPAYNERATTLLRVALLTRFILLVCVNFKPVSQLLQLGSNLLDRASATAATQGGGFLFS